MKILITLNPHLQNAAEVQAELNGEFNALQRKGVEVTSKTFAPRDGALAGPEIFQFLIDHHQDIVSLVNLLTAVIQISNAVLVRRNIIPAKSSREKAKTSRGHAIRRSKTASSSPITLILGELHLNLPCTAQQAKTFIKKASKQDTNKTRES